MVVAKLGLPHTPVIAHASLRASAEVVGGADSLLRVIFDSVLALLEDQIRECPGFAGHSAGSGAIAGDRATRTRQAPVGNALIQAMPVRAVRSAVEARLRADPLALLYGVARCLRFEAVHEAVLLVVAALPSSALQIPPLLSRPQATVLNTR